MKRSLLYVTFDGVLQPLGFSQVARLLIALSKAGWNYRLLSIERVSDLEDRSKVERVRSAFDANGIVWDPIPVTLSGSALRAAEALVRTAARMRHHFRRSDIGLVHARGYQATLLSRRLGLPYLFDARGCWIEERTDWFSRAPAYAAGKLIERGLVMGARGIVTLTELHRSDLVELFGYHEPSRALAIPTCADYDQFTIPNAKPGKPHHAHAIPEELQKRLRGKIVVAMVGSLNSSYLVKESISLVRHAIARDRRVHLLILSQQGDAYQQLLAQCAVPPDAYTVAAARHDEMPEWMRWIDWGFLLLPELASKRGSMPTKLAEFFATGVRPIAYGCNSEMMGWVRRARSGIVLDGVDENSLHEASQEIVRARDANDLSHARDVTAEHFSLRSAVRRYAQLFDELLE